MCVVVGGGGGEEEEEERENEREGIQQMLFECNLRPALNIQVIRSLWSTSNYTMDHFSIIPLIIPIFF